MTPPTEELTRLLTGAADDIVERDRVPGPDAPVLWRRGRRVTWAGRAAAAGIVAVVLLLVMTGGRWSSPASPRPRLRKGGTLTYPQVVSDMFADVRRRRRARLRAGRHPPTEPQSPDSLVIERQGSLTSLGTGPCAATTSCCPTVPPHRRWLPTGSGPSPTSATPTPPTARRRHHRPDQRCGDPPDQHRPRDPVARPGRGACGARTPSTSSSAPLTGRPSSMPSP